MTADNAYRAKAWECLSLAERTNDPAERAEIVRFASMWMSLAEPIEETQGSYEFPRGGGPPALMLWALAHGIVALAPTVDYGAGEARY